MTQVVAAYKVAEAGGVAALILTPSWKALCEQLIPTLKIHLKTAGLVILVFLDSRIWRCALTIGAAPKKPNWPCVCTTWAAALPCSGCVS